MTPVALIQGDFSGAQTLAAAYLEEHWYAAYTRANHEKRVAEQLDLRAVKHFLPLYKTVRRWKDRRVCLEMPLFPGYVFVRLALVNRLSVLQVSGVVHLVGFDGSPAAVPEEDVLRVQELLSRGMRAEPHPFLRVGRRVRVMAGPLAGLEGILVRRKNRVRFVVSVELILRSIAVEVDEGDLEPISGEQRGASGEG